MARSWWLLVSLVLLVSPTPRILAAASELEPRGAEDAHGPSVHIPEPLVFDLVRPLGARKGEAETNVLALGPSGPDDDLLWAPEVEVAVVDGFALELELPFVGSELEALKLAAQLSFGGASSGPFLHGTQVIAERFRDDGLWELTFLYLPAYRFDDTWSALGMAGIRVPLSGDADNELILNLTPFADVGPYTSLGVEVDLDWEFQHRASILLMPQVHQELGTKFMIQAGLGYESTPRAEGVVGAARAIYSF